MAANHHPSRAQSHPAHLLEEAKGGVVVVAVVRVRLPANLAGRGGGAGWGHQTGQGRTGEHGQKGRGATMLLWRHCQLASAPVMSQQRMKILRQAASVQDRKGPRFLGNFETVQSCAAAPARLTTARWRLPHSSIRNQRMTWPPSNCCVFSCLQGRMRCKWPALLQRAQARMRLPRGRSCQCEATSLSCRPAGLATNLAANMAANSPLADELGQAVVRGVGLRSVQHLLRKR